jgi:hypothetical protein
MPRAPGCAGGSAGPACKSAGAGHLNARAKALALLGHRGSQSEVTGIGRSAIPALPQRVTGVVAPGTRSALSGVFCTSAGNCWAVGNFDSTTSGATLNEVLHWDGTNWSQVTVPSPGGNALGDASELTAVRCRVASDCWAVGRYFNANGATLNQALHWNGTKWSVMPTPTPGGTLNGDDNELFDVNCSAANFCWAAGEYGNKGIAGVTLNQLLRWNGHKWSLVAGMPQPAGTSDGDFQGLGSVRCTSVSNCLAVGSFGTEGSTVIQQNEALRWDGTKWSTLTVVSPGGTANFDFSVLSGLACNSATNCWAAGSYGNFAGPTSLNQILFWDGTTWTQDNNIANPDGTGQGAANELLGATCSSASNCWAIGDFGSIQNSQGEILNQALHWDGAAWSLTLPPNPGGITDGSFNSLSAVRCTAKTNCWAVGGTDRVNVALHWDGAMWSTG